MTQFEVPVNALKLWFWMIDDSGEPNLAEQSERALLTLFNDIESARNYLETHQPRNLS